MTGSMTDSEIKQAARAHLDKRRGAMEEAVVKTAKDNALSYIGLRGYRSPDSITHAVQCPLPGYEHLTVHYRTNNSVKRMKGIPSIVATPEAAAIEAALAETELEPDDPKVVEMQERYKEIMDQAIAQLHRERNAWLSLFVIRIDGWNFARRQRDEAGKIVLDDSGEPVWEPIPVPNSDDPTSYECLYEEFEDLNQWLPYDGYALALEVAQGPQFRSRPGAEAEAEGTEGEG